MSAFDLFGGFGISLETPLCIKHKMHVSVVLLLFLILFSMELQENMKKTETTYNNARNSNKRH